MNEDRIVDLFRALDREDFWKVESNAEDLHLHFNAPDGDGTHYSLVLDGDGTWLLYDEDREQVAYDGLP